MIQYDYYIISLKKIVVKLLDLSDCSAYNFSKKPIHNLYFSNLHKVIKSKTEKRYK